MRRAAAALIAATALLAPLCDSVGAVEKGASFLPGSTGREPISIDAAKLDYFDKEQKLVYAGDVVARQGFSTLKGSVLTIFLSKDSKKGGKEPVATTDGPSPAAGSSIDHMEITGPVTVISKDEVGTGDNGTYDRVSNKITLVGNVTLTQATNVIKGDRLVYDMTSGQAQVSSGQTQSRVRSVFTPGSGTPNGVPGPGAAKKPKSSGGETAKTP